MKLIVFPGTTKKVQIRNLDVGTLKKMLSFIYTDNFETENANLVDLVINSVQMIN